MKDSNKWLVEDKCDKVCYGYCREIEQGFMLNMPWYLKNIIRNYHPNNCWYDDKCLFRK